MRKNILSFIIVAFSLSVIPIIPDYSNADSNNNYEVKELPYEATNVNCIGDEYYQVSYDKSDCCKKTVIDSNGNVIIPTMNTPLSFSYSDGIFSLTGDNLSYEYIATLNNNSTTKDFTVDNEQIIITPKFYDKNGKELFDSSFIKTSTPFNDGYALVTIEETDKDSFPFLKEVIINSKGKITYTLPNYIYPNSYGGWIDEKQMIGVEGKYSVWRYIPAQNLIWNSERYSDGMTITTNKKFEKITELGYVDANGTTIIPPISKYSYAGAFHNGLAYVSINDKKYGFINKNGIETIPIKYDYVYDFGIFGDFYTVVKENNEWIIIDTNGNTIYKLGEYTKIGGTNGKVVTLGKRDKLGAVDLDNNIIIPFEYDDITSIQGNSCMAIKEGKLYSIKFNSKYSPDASDITTSATTSLTSTTITTSLPSTSLTTATVTTSPSKALKDNSSIYKINPTDGSNSKSKPVLEVSKIMFDNAETARKQKVTVTFTLNGENVDNMYAVAGYHIYWDDRLKVIPTQTGAFAKKGEALYDVTTTAQNGKSGVFVAGASSSNEGHTGIMWTINFEIPDNAKDGDVFPIDVAYGNDTSGSGDFFRTCDQNSEESKLMQAFFFTQGIHSKSNPSDDPYLIKANATFADGYIAINDLPVRSSTTTTEVTPTEKVLFGDANCDGVINMADAVSIMQSIANPDKYGLNGKDNTHITAQGQKNADCYNVGDGITNADALSIQKYMVKIITSLPENK